MANKILVFKDLWEYIQSAERDSSGMNYPFHGDNELVEFGFHIYSGRNQVNICRGTDGIAFSSIANFVFDDDEVSVIRVNNHQIADYDNPLRISITTPIDDVPSEWTSYLGISGKIVQAIFQLVLQPVSK